MAHEDIPGGPILEVAKLETPYSTRFWRRAEVYVEVNESDHGFWISILLHEVAEGCVVEYEAAGKISEIYVGEANTKQ